VQGINITNILFFGLKAYQGSESQEIGPSSGLKGKDEWWENLSEEPNSSLRGSMTSEQLEWVSRTRGIIWGSNADYLQIIYLNNQLSQMSTWLHISGLIVESSIIQNSIFSKQ